jgi:hypothetical protein
MMVLWEGRRLKTTLVTVITIVTFGCCSRENGIPEVRFVLSLIVHGSILYLFRPFSIAM